jgi:hypothetical protein
LEASLEAFVLSPEQEDTVALLDRLFGRAIANRYDDFCRLAASATELRVSRPLAVHALRELESMVRSSLEVPMDAKLQPVKDQRETQVRAALKALGYDNDAVREAIKGLAPRLNHATQIKMIAERLGFAPDSDVVRAWVALSKISSGKAHDRAFHRSLVIDEDFRETFQRPFELVLRSVVVALQTRYSALMRRVEQIAAMTDYAGAVRQYEREIPGALPLQWHFFQTIENPRWLPHLLERNLTDEPLEALVGAGTRQLREWPVGHYLLKLAKGSEPDAHRDVAAAIRGVATSKHPDVRQQGLEIIASLPPDVAVTLVDIAADWLDPNEPTFYHKAPEQLIKQLAEAGFSSEAISFAGVVFQVFDRQGSLASLHPQQMYEHHLPEAAKVLVVADGLAALDLFSKLLIQSEIIANRFGERADDDYTYITPHPLSNSQMATYGITEALTIAVRDAGLAVCSKGPKHVDGAAKLLLGYAPLIFKRIALHVLSKHADSARRLSASLLQDTSLIGKSWCEDEYAELALARFPTMTVEEQCKVLDVIDVLPDDYRIDWAGRFESHETRAPGAADIRTFDLCVVRDAMWKWKDALPEPRRREVEAIAAEFGSPDDWKHRFFPEEVSPITGSELSTQPIPVIVAFLKDWQPQAEPARQTITALGQQLRSAVEQEPIRFADEADQFSALRPIYVRRLLEGFDSKARNTGALTWGPVLKLLGDVTYRLSHSENEHPAAEGDDKDWLWTGSAAAALLKSGLRQGARGISYEHAPEILSIIQRVFNDAPRQLPNDFEENFWRHPYFSSEQSLWGSAIELAVLFLFWSSKQEASIVAQQQRAALELLPEIRLLLETALSHVTEIGCVPRAILGRYLGWLSYFGESWVKAHVSELFPEKNETLRRAAWLGHLLNDSGPAKALTNHLLSSYLDEIDRLASDEDAPAHEHREHRLGDYVLILFLVDAAPDELMRVFWEEAPPKARAHAMSFLGRELALPPDHLAGDIRKRGLGYWEARLAAALSAGDRDAFRSELGVIGQWCGKDNIDPTWLLDQLLRLLDAGLVPNSGYAVVDWLGKIAVGHPDKSVEVLNALLKNPRTDHWTYAAHRDSIRLVLKTGLTQGTSATAELAKELVSFLATIGESSYLDLVRLEGA